MSSLSFGYTRHQAREQQFNQMTPTLKEEDDLEQHQDDHSVAIQPRSSATNSSSETDSCLHRSSPNSSVSFGTVSSSNSSLNNGYNSLNCSITSSSSGSYVNSTPTSSSSRSSASFCEANHVADNLKLLSLASKNNNNQIAASSLTLISSANNNNINDINNDIQQQLDSSSSSGVSHSVNDFNNHQQRDNSSSWSNCDTPPTNKTRSSICNNNNSYSSLQAKPLKCFESRSAYVEAMKEDLAEWLNRLYPDLDLTSANFFARLETGSIICRHANYVTNMARKSLSKDINHSFEAIQTKSAANINKSQIDQTSTSTTTLITSEARPTTNSDKQRRQSNSGLQLQRSRIPRSKSNYFTPSKSYSSLNILINSNHNNNNNTCKTNQQQQINYASQFDRSIRGAANSPVTPTLTSMDSISSGSSGTDLNATCQRQIDDPISAISPSQRHHSHQQQNDTHDQTSKSQSVTFASTKNKYHLIDWLKVRILSFKLDARPGTFFARDNICQFIHWCRSLNILDCLLFETDDLVARKNERSFILCMLEVARIGFNVGVPTPLIIQLEQEIDREIENDAKQQQQQHQQVQHATSATINHQTNEQPNYVQLQENVEVKPDDDDEYGPKPQVITNDLMSLHEKVVQLLCQCTCPTQFPMVPLGDNGKYRVGDKLIIFVRILRRHIMVRVGGGWQELSEFLRAKDPCRMRPQTNQHCSMDWSANNSGSPSTLNNNMQHQHPATSQRLSSGNLHYPGSSPTGLMTIATHNKHLDNKCYKQNNNNSDYGHYVQPTTRSSLSGSASMNWISHNSRC